MKTKLFFFFAMLISLHGFSQKKVGEQKIDMILIPATDSGVSIQSFYMSNEITNKQYRAFTDFASQHLQDGLSYYDNAGRMHFTKYSVIQKNIIDSSAMEKAGGAEFKNYFTNSKYDDYPVVGVSFLNAQLFCSWLIEQEKQLGQNTDAKIRLPYVEEWRYAAQSKVFYNAVPRNYVAVSTGTKNKFGLTHFIDNPDEYCESMEGKIFIMGEQKPLEMARNYTSETQQSANAGFRIVQTYIGK